MSESKAESKGESKDESKAGAPKGTDRRASFMDSIQEFCMSSQLEREFEEFAKAHADVFRASVDLKDGDEHPLAFHAVYREYLAVFERRIEKFAEGVGCHFKCASEESQTNF
jgi:hypothetical protein